MVKLSKAATPQVSGLRKSDQKLRPILSSLKVSTAIATAALGISASPLLAQSTLGSNAFWEDDRWHVSGGRFCVLEPKPLVSGGLSYEAIGEVERFGKPGETLPADSILMFRADPQVMPEDQSQQVIFKFDEMSFLGQRHKSTYAPALTGEKVEEAFKAARTLSIYHGTKVIAEFSLRGSSKAMDMLRQCTRTKPDPSAIPIAVQPTIPPIERPIVPEPNLKALLPANRPPSPIRPDLWFMPEDIGIREDFTGSTTIGVLMNVSPKGKAVECEVLEPSDHPGINEETCSLIEAYARFDPATNSEGELIFSRYSTKVTFKAP